MSQAGFADLLEISLSSLKRYEKGEGELSASLLLKIAEISKVSPIWLLTGRGKLLANDEEMRAARAFEITERLFDKKRPKTREAQLRVFGRIYEYLEKSDINEDDLIFHLVDIDGGEDSE